jgi:ribonuclease PH
LARVKILTIQRPTGRDFDELRVIDFDIGFTRNAAGSVLASVGETRVLCTASVEDSVPNFLRGKGQGWVTAEYSMLPGSTHTRSSREASRGKLSGRTQEIQRLIGRSLRAVMNLGTLGARTVTLDCDVLQADGGTRTTAISGAYIALMMAIENLIARGTLDQSPVYGQVAAVSVGLYKGRPVLDLDYAEDSVAETDMNIVMNDAGAFIEVQGTAEGHAFRRNELDALLDLAAQGVKSIMEAQTSSLAAWRTKR